MSGDARWLSRIYRGSVALALLLVAATLALGWRMPLGVAVGAALGLGGMAFFDWVMTRAIREGQGKRRVTVVMLLRYPLVIAVLVACGEYGVVHPVGLCLGVGVVPAVATALAVGELLRQRHA